MGSTRRHAAASVAFLMAMSLMAEAPIVVDLRYAPRKDEKAISPVAQYFSQAPTIPISVRFTREARVAAGTEQIGEAGPQSPRTPIYSARPVTAFIEEGAMSQLKQWGLPVSSEASVVLRGEVREFLITEGRKYEAEIDIAYSVCDRAGKVLWQGDIRAEGSTSGAARKTQNYLEVASEALRENLRALMAKSEFRDAYTGKSGPQVRGTSMSPGELKAAVQELMKEGLEQELLIAFVRQSRISPPFSTEDILQWKAAGIPQQVITAALGAAASSAKQGALEEKPSSQTEFPSPMVLDIPAPDFRELASTLAWATNDTGRYTCEGVSLETLTVTPDGEQDRPSSDGSGKERISVYRLGAHFRVPKSYDRSITLRVQLRQGNRMVASTAFRGVDAEEERTTVARAELAVRTSELNAVFDGEPKPTLHLDMTVK